MTVEIHVESVKPRMTKCCAEGTGSIEVYVYSSMEEARESARLMSQNPRRLIWRIVEDAPADAKRRSYTISVDDYEAKLREVVEQYGDH
jgi:hypothetical protein